VPIIELEDGTAREISEADYASCRDLLCEWLAKGGARVRGESIKQVAFNLLGYRVKFHEITCMTRGFNLTVTT
jgi:hypothetical protein